MARTSDLDRLISPEIKDDRFYKFITWVSARACAKHVLEIGSSAGGGSTEAFVRGLAANRKQPILHCIEISAPRFEALSQAYAHVPFVRCYNMSSVSADEFPSEERVSRFYREEDSRLVQYPLDEVLRWLRQDIDYLRVTGVAAGAIEHIKRAHSIVNFDLVLIDGSEFTGEVEFEKVQGARIIMLDDICTFKNWSAHKRLRADSDYELVLEDRELRNGFSVFCRRGTPLGDFEKEPTGVARIGHYLRNAFR
jgi:hypothetical protein